ncbi:MAG: DUF1028 domain-containing protein, partial [Ignavibacteriales bacterium]|nr:DUF1028 domain-containing protein [Ignavibacteriales bacterium]
MIKSLFILLLFVFQLCVGQNFPKSHPSEIVGTISIVAVDTLTGDIGVAILSRVLSVGAIAPYAKAGVGAVATQATANTTYGPVGLEMLARGVEPYEVIGAMLVNDGDTTQRQVGMVDAKGNSYAFTGSGCVQKATHMFGPGYSVQGNVLSSESIVKAVGRSFEISHGTLPDRLLDALESGERAGADAGYRSAALLVVRENGGYMGFNDRYVDVRVDDSPTPMDELRRIYKLWMNRFTFDTQIRSIEVFMQQNNVAAARTELQRLVNDLNAQLRDKPDDPDVLNRIAFILATYDIDRERALDLAKRAAKLEPTNDRVLSTLAECHFYLGHYEEAIAIGAELVKRSPANDNFWKRLQKYRE